MARPTGRPVRDEILIAARSLIQQVGVGGFSYADLAGQLGIKAPSIHHHFRTKENLVAEVAVRYREEFGQMVSAIDDPSPMERIRRYGDLFDQTASSELLCLCGVVAAEWLTVGDLVKDEVGLFFDEQATWLTEQLAAGKSAGEVRSDVDVAATAQLLMASLEGALLMARAGGDSSVVSGTTQALLATLQA